MHCNPLQFGVFPTNFRCNKCAYLCIKKFSFLLYKFYLLPQEGLRMRLQEGIIKLFDLNFQTNFV